MSPTAPPITSVDVQGFQSLHHVSIDLGRLTVIVGPSSSGKSAFVRALKTLHYNARGTSFITQGFKRTKITADLHDGTSVSLTRSAGTKDNAYTLAPAPDFTPEPEPLVFTKLNGEVPAEIKNLLPAIPGLTFASQFDKPYLLDASPSDVARTLASLTNVHVILAAAREANRRRLASGSTLKTRQSDLEQAQSRLRDYEGLPGALRAQESAEASLRTAQSLTARISRLSLLLQEITEVSEAEKRHARILASAPVPPSLSDLETMAWRRDSLRSLTRDALQALKAEQDTQIPTAPVPSITRAQSLLTSYTSLRTTLMALKAAGAAQSDAQGRITEQNDTMAAALDAYAAALEQAGTCPTCGQGTEHVHDSTKEMLR